MPTKRGVERVGKVKKRFCVVAGDLPHREGAVQGAVCGVVEGEVGVILSVSLKRSQMLDIKHGASRRVCERDKERGRGRGRECE